jgi:hypothetical protein
MMMKKKHEIPDEWVPAGPEEIKEILLWLCGFALLFILITYGAIFLIDNTSATLNNPIHLIGGDG